MAVEGSLEAFRLSDILQVVAHQRKTGILTVQGESDIVAISFLRGQVVAADALTRTVEDGLGDVLVRQGLLTREHFDAVAARNQAGAGRLIDLLVEGGRVGRAELLAALREQTQTVLLELLDWQQGEFKFYSGDEVSFEDGFVPISIEELLLRHLEVWEGDAAAVPGDDAVHERRRAAAARDPRAAGRAAAGRGGAGGRALALARRDAGLGAGGRPGRPPPSWWRPPASTPTRSASPSTGC